MYLSRIDMKLSDPKVRNAMGNAQIMHKLTTGLFQDTRDRVSLIYRVRVAGQVVSIYQYARTQVLRNRLQTGMHLCGERDMKDWLDSMQEGQIWGFDLLTMPFRKVPKEDGGNSRRRIIPDKDNRLEWLSRKASQSGFSILNAEEMIEGTITAIHPAEKGGKMIMNAYRYTGKLIILDAEVFRNAVCKGIGPGKAYGLGMMLLMR